MDNMEYVQEEEGGWFGANWYLIILNMIIGAVVFFVIWFFSKQGEEEEKEEENDVCTANESPKKENKAEPIVEVKTSVNVDWKPQVTTDAPVVEKVTTCTKTEIKTTETIVEKVLVEEIGQKEVPAATVFVEEEKPLLDIDVVVKEPAKPEPKKESKCKLIFSHFHLVSSILCFFHHWEHLVIHGFNISIKNHRQI